MTIKSAIKSEANGVALMASSDDLTRKAISRLHNILEHYHPELSNPPENAPALSKIKLSQFGSLVDYVRFMSSKYGCRDWRSWVTLLDKEYGDLVINCLGETSLSNPSTPAGKPSEADDGFKTRSGKISSKIQSESSSSSKRTISSIELLEHDPKMEPPTKSKRSKENVENAEHILEPVKNGTGYALVKNIGSETYFSSLPTQPLVHVPVVKSGDLVSVLQIEPTKFGHMMPQHPGLLGNVCPPIRTNPRKIAAQSAHPYFKPGEYDPDVRVRFVDALDFGSSATHAPFYDSSRASTHGMASDSELLDYIVSKREISSLEKPVTEKEIIEILDPEGTANTEESMSKILKFDALSQDKSYQSRQTQTIDNESHDSKESTKTIFNGTQSSVDNDIKPENPSSSDKSISLEDLLKKADIDLDKEIEQLNSRVLSTKDIENWLEQISCLLIEAEDARNLRLFLHSDKMEKIYWNNQSLVDGKTLARIHGKLGDQSKKLSPKSHEYVKKLLTTPTVIEKQLIESVKVRLFNFILQSPPAQALRRSESMRKSGEKSVFELISDLDLLIGAPDLVYRGTLKPRNAPPGGPNPMQLHHAQAMASGSSQARGMPHVMGLPRQQPSGTQSMRMTQQQQQQMVVAQQQYYARLMQMHQMQKQQQQYRG